MDNPFQEILQRLDHIEQMILELKDQGTQVMLWTAMLY